MAEPARILQHPSATRILVHPPAQPVGVQSVWGWAKESLQEGERLLQQDQNYVSADINMAYVMGQHAILAPTITPSYLLPIVSNETRRAYRVHVSALTDLQPQFEFACQNPKYQPSAHVLNRYTVAWWLNALVDLDLADTLRYALACGSGDTLLEFDPYFMGGEQRAFARDPRDTIPIQPQSGRDIQEWEGLILRDEFPCSRLLAKFPGRTDAIKPASGALGSVFSRMRPMVLYGQTPMASGNDQMGVVEQLQARRRNQNRPVASAACIVYREFIRDRSVNRSGAPIIVGMPGTSWSYKVEPNFPLYPRGRLIIWTEHGVLFDGPSPFWHRNFPISRLTLDRYPWSFLGASLGADLRGGQDAINRIVNLIVQNLSQHVERGVTFDPNYPVSDMARFDPRRRNWKMQKPNKFSPGFQLADVSSLPQWALPFLDRLYSRFETLSGAQNYAQLLQLRQSPSGDTIEKYMNALTPEIRLEARAVEVYLRDIATQFKSNLFQFISKPKRMQILGDQGRVLEDFDYDPNNMVPALDKSDEAYTPELDKDKPLEERAYYFSSILPFHVAPGSMLNTQANEKKMEAIMLSRMGFLDPWTLMERLGYKNFGAPPNSPLPKLDWTPPNFPPGTDQATIQAAMMPPLEMRQPITILEKLLVAKQLGIGLTESPVGRKASGQESPQMQQKGSGADARVTMTES